MPKVNLNPLRNLLGLDGVLLVINSKIDQAVKKTSNVQFNNLTATGDLLVDGNFQVNGSTTVIESSVLKITDALVQINVDNANPLSFGGIQVNRGPGLNPFQFVYNESNKVFEVGDPNSLQPVATRELNPTPLGIAVWNAPLNRFDTQTTLAAYTFTSLQTNSLTFGSPSGPQFSSNASGLVLSTPSNVTITSSLSTPINLTLPTNMSLVFGTASLGYDQTTGGILVNSPALVLQSSTNLSWGNGTGITSGGLDLIVTARNISLAASGKATLPSLVQQASTTLATNSSGQLTITTLGDTVISTPGKLIASRIGLGANSTMSADSLGNTTFSTSGNMTFQPNGLLMTLGNLYFSNVSNYIGVATPDLMVKSLSGQIVLSSQTAVLLANNAPLKLGSNTQLSESLLGDVQLQSMGAIGNINLVPGQAGQVTLPINKFLTFASTETIYSNGNDMTLTSNRDIVLAPGRNLVLPQNKNLVLGTATFSQTSTGNLLVTSSGDITLAPQGVTRVGNFSLGYTSSITDTSTNLTINTPTYVNFPSPVTFLNTVSLDGTTNCQAIIATTLTTSDTTSLVANAIVVDATGLMTLTPKSLSSGTAMSLLSSWDSNSGYTIGRGTSGGRSTTFTVPDYSSYGSGGVVPNFVFKTVSGVQLVKMDTNGMTISSGTLKVTDTSNQALSVAGTITASSTITTTLSVPNSLTVTSNSVVMETPTSTISLNVGSGSFLVDNTNFTVNIPAMFQQATTVHQLTVQSNLSILGTTSFGAHVSLEGNVLTNLALPVNGSDAVPKSYADNLARGTTQKASVNVTSTAPVDLTGTVTSIDGVPLVQDFRVLLKDQVDSKQNGIYIVNGGILTRALDMAAGSNGAGAAVFTIGGAINSGVGFISIGTETVTVGTVNLVFTAFTGAAQITVSPGLVKSGNNLSLNTDSSLDITTGALRVSTGIAGQGLTGGGGTPLSVLPNQTQINQVGTITTGSWQASTVSLPFGGTGLTSVPLGRLLYGSTSNTLQYSDSLVYTGGNLGVGVLLPQANLHIVSGVVPPKVLVEDTSLSATPSLVLKRGATTATLSLSTSGDLYLGQDQGDTNSTLSLATMGLTRLSIDSTGNTTVSNNLTAKNLTTGNVTMSGSLSVSGTTISVPSTGNLTLSTPRLDLTSFRATASSSVGNLSLQTTSTLTSIVSTAPQTNLSIPMSLGASSTPSLYITTTGVQIPHSLQLGGSYLDVTSGINLSYSTSTGTLTIPGKTLFTDTLTSTHGLFLYDSASPGQDISFLVSGNAGYIQSSQPGMGMYIGQGTNNLTTIIGNASGTSYIKYDPNSSSFIVSPSTNTLIQGNLTLYGTVSDYTSNGVAASLPNDGWYYLGPLGIGSTTITASLAWTAVITYDGITNYSVALDLRYRQVASLVIYNVNGVYELFIQVNSSPLSVRVLESPTILSLVQFEGSGTSPDGTTSGFTSLTFILDYTLASAQATASREMGTLLVTGQSTLSSLAVHGSLNLTGTLNSTGNSNFIGTDFFWSRPFGNIASFNSDQFQNNSITVYSGDTSSAQINFNRTSEKGFMGLVSATSVNYPGSLMISHQSPDSNSKVILATRNIPRVILTDTGVLEVLSTTDATGSSLGSFTVAGGMTVQKTLSATTLLQTPLLKLINGQANVYLKSDAFGNLTFNNNTSTITGLCIPTRPSDAVTLSYVQGLIQGLDLKTGVTAASAGQNVDLTQPTPTVDGIALLAGNRVLLKDQTNAVENGLYYVVTSGIPLARTSDLSNGSSAARAFVFVNQGTVNSNAGWVCNSASGNDNVGVNAIEFIQFSGAGEIIAGQGILKTGNRLDVQIDNTSIESFANTLRVSSGAIGLGLSGGSGAPISITSISHLTTLGTIQTGVWNASPVSVAYGGTGSTTFYNGNVPYSNGVTLTQGGLYFDSTNVRLGINTTSPTSGVTVQDRDMQFVQTGNTTSALVMTSSITNYTYSMRHESDNLIFSSGAGNSRNGLVDTLVLKSSGVLASNVGITSPYATLGNYTLTGGTMSNSNGSANLQLYSSDNSGTTISLYGGLGTVNNPTNTEFLRAGYYNGEYRIQTTATGSGSARDLVIQTGSNTNQLLISSSGNASFAGNLTVSSTTDNSALLVAGGMTVGKTMNAQSLIVSNELVSGTLQVNSVTLLDWFLSTTADNSLSFASQVNAASYMDLFSLVGTGATDLGLRFYSKGTTSVGTSNEWCQVRWDSTGQRYEFAGTHGGTGNYHPISISASGNNQIQLGTDNSVTISGALTSVQNVKILSTMDAINSSSGGALTISGGLAVSKSVYLGTALTSPAVNVTNTLNFSNSGSVDKSSLGYTGSGQTVLYNNRSNVLVIHAGNSNGPGATDQERLSLGYGDNTSFSINTTATGAGVLKDLVLSSGSSLRLGANGIISTSGFLQANGGLSVTGTSQFTGSTILLGSLSISETGVLGTLLNLAGTWVLTQTDLYTTSSIALSTSSKYIFTNASSSPLLTIDAIGTITSNARLAISLTDSNAMTIKNASGTSVFIFDTNLSQFNLGGSRAVNAGYPISATDLVTKSYVDSVAKGLNLKSSVTAASTVGQNVNVTSPVPVVDGVTLTGGNRVLLKDQTSAIENGIYTVLVNGYLTRAPDLATGSNAGGSFTFIQQGTTHADSGYVCTAATPNDIVGTNLLYFTQFNGNTISAGTGLTKDVNNAVSISLSTNSGLNFSAGALQINPSIAGTGLSYTNGVLSVGGAGGTSQLGTVTSGTWRASVISMQYGGTGSNNFNLGSVVYSDGTELTSDPSNFYWDSTKKALGLGTSTPDPNNAGDGLTLFNKDLLLQGGKVLFSSSTGLYNWQLNSYSNLLTLAYGNTSTKSALSELFVFTNSSLGIGYTGATANAISATLDIVGTLKVSSLVNFSTPLPVSSGGTGTNTITSGVVTSVSGVLTSTGILGDGKVVIGNASGGYNIEGGSILRAHLGLALGVNIQAYNTNLDGISSVTASTGTFLVGNGSTFVGQSASTVRSTLGLGTLALLNSVGNANWSGSPLSVTNGGTGATTFTTNDLLYYNGTSFVSSPLAYDSTNFGFTYGTTLTSGNGLQLYSDMSVQASTTSIPVGYNIQNVDSTFAWSLHKRDEGNGNQSSSFVISGGLASSTKSGLTDSAIFKSNGDILLASTSECTDINTGALVVSGGISIAKQGYFAESIIVYGAVFGLEGAAFDKAVNIGGELEVNNIVIITNTSDANYASPGSLTTSGGASFGKSIYTNGKLTLDNTVAKATANTFPLTVAVDNTANWVQDTDLTDSYRTMTIVNSGASSGVSCTSLRNTHSGVTWDNILDGTSGNLIFQRTTSSQTRTWLTLAQSTGVATLFSTNAASLTCLGGATFAKGITTGGSITTTESNAFGTGVVSTNTSSASTSYSSIALGNDMGIANIFLNSSTRTSDGNANALTVRNQIGDLRLQGSTSSGLTITALGSILVDLPETLTCTSDATSSTSGGALTVKGGVAIAKSLVVGGNVSFPGAVGTPSLTTTPVTNVTTVGTLRTKTTLIGVDMNLLVSFQVTPTGAGSASFTMVVPNKTSTFTSRTDVTATTVGWSSDSNPIPLSGLLTTGVSNTKTIQINFTALDTSAHFIQLVVYYDTS